jgi:hypothetical protein
MEGEEEEGDDGFVCFGAAKGRGLCEYKEGSCCVGPRKLHVASLSCYSLCSVQGILFPLEPSIWIYQKNEREMFWDRHTIVLLFLLTHERRVNSTRCTVLSYLNQIISY